MIELKLSRQSRHPILHCYSYFIDLYFSYCWTLWLKLSTLWQEFFCNPKLCQTYIVSWNSIFPPSKILPSSNFFPHCEIFLPKFGGNFPGGNIPPNTRSWNWPLNSGKVLREKPIRSFRRKMWNQWNGFCTKKSQPKKLNSVTPIQQLLPRLALHR